MYGMKFPLDVAFLDEHGRVIALYAPLSPGSRSRWHRQASHALELRAGTLAESATLMGDVLFWTAARGPAEAERNHRVEAAS
jgi:uncharacterized membrane protein (UPF0127 family)